MPRPARTALLPRRQQILDAATWTFARKGYRATSIDAIIHRAGVARGTFYLYFDSKEQVFLAIVGDFYRRLEQLVHEPELPVRLGEHGGRSMMRRAMCRWLELFAAHRDAALVVLREGSAIDPRFEASLARLRALGVAYFAERFRRLQRAGLVNRSVAPELLAHFQLGMIVEVVSAFVLAQRSSDIEELAAQLAAFAWEGIRPATHATTDA